MTNGEGFSCFLVIGGLVVGHFRSTLCDSHSPAIPLMGESVLWLFLNANILIPAPENVGRTTD